MPAHRRRGRPAHDDILTPAEWRVVEAVRHGLTNPAIARRQGISLDAVKYHVANALQKTGFEKRAQLRQWDGIRRDSALRQGGKEMSKEFELGAIGQVSRTVSDLAAAEKWYKEVLRLRHLYTFGDLAFFDMDGVRLFLSQGVEGNAESILYFRVPNIHAAHRELRDRGVSFVNAPHLIHKHSDGKEEWMAFFKDNEDRLLAIMAQVAP